MAAPDGKVLRWVKIRQLERFIVRRVQQWAPSRTWPTPSIEASPEPTVDSRKGTVLGTEADSTTPGRAAVQPLQRLRMSADGSTRESSENAASLPSPASGAPSMPRVAYSEAPTPSAAYCCGTGGSRSPSACLRRRWCGSRPERTVLAESGRQRFGQGLASYREERHEPPRRISRSLSNFLNAGFVRKSITSARILCGCATVVLNRGSRAPAAGVVGEFVSR